MLMAMMLLQMLDSHVEKHCGVKTKYAMYNRALFARVARCGTPNEVSDPKTLKFTMISIFLNHHVFEKNLFHRNIVAPKRYSRTLATNLMKTH